MLVRLRKLLCGILFLWGISLTGQGMHSRAAIDPEGTKGVVAATCYYPESTGAILPITASLTVWSYLYTDHPVNDIATAAYRSAASGSWDAPDTWEYNISGTTYVATTIPPSSGNDITIQAGHTVFLTLDFGMNAGKSFTVNGTLNTGGFLVSGPGNFTLAAGATLGIGSPSGIGGNIATGGSTYFSSSGSYVFNGTTAQQTGSFATSPLANTVASIEVRNAGNSVTNSFGSSVVADRLILQAGTLMVGSGNTIHVNTSGFVSGNGGTLAAGSGLVNFMGSATVNGSTGLSFNDLTVNGGVITLATIPVINGRLTLKGGSLSAAPKYGVASTLIYEGPVARSTEWAASGTGTPGVTPGYPFNVSINAGSFDIFNGSSNIACGGLFSIGNAAVVSFGSMNMPFVVAGGLSVAAGCTLNMAAMTAAISVAGDLSNSGSLTLSASGGGDLRLAGQFANNGSFVHNNRTVTLNGSSPQALSGTFNGTAANNCLYNLVVQNTSGGVWLNTPVNVMATVTLLSGLMYLGASNLTLSAGGSMIAGNAFGVGNMIVINGAGSLAYKVNSGFSGTLVYPIGETTNVTEYSPFSLTLSNLGIAGSIGVRVINLAHPQLEYPASNDRLNRYWTCTSTGFSAYTWSASATYTDADVNGNAASLKFNAWLAAPENAWQEYATTVNTVSKTLSLTGGNFGGLNGTEFTGRVNQPLYYRIAGTGPSNWATPASWEVSGNPSFATSSPAVFYPTALNSGGILIAAGQTINCAVAVSADDLTVEGTLNINSGAAFVLNNGAAATDFTLGGSGRLNLNGGSFTSATGSLIAVSGGGYWYSALPSVSTAYNGTASFASNSTYENAVNGGTIPPASWNSNAMLYFSGNQTGTIGGLGQSFGNLRWNCAQTATINLGIGTVTGTDGFKVQGNMTIENTGASARLVLFSETSPGAFNTISVGGNLSISGGRLELLNGGTPTAGKSVALIIGGNLNLSGTGSLNLTGTTAIGSTLHSPRVNLSGNLMITGSARLLQPQDCLAAFYFDRPSGSQFYGADMPSTAISAAKINWQIGSGSSANTLSLNNNFTAFSNAAVTVNNGASLVCTGETVVSGGGANMLAGFVLNGGASLHIGSAGGISLSGASGNIQFGSSRSFAGAASYNYIGSTSQITGNGLPASITGALSISNTGTANNRRVTLSNNNTQVNTLNLYAGELACGSGQNLNIAAGGTVNGYGGGQPDDPVSGSITFLGNGSTRGFDNSAGSPRLYAVNINGGVDFNGNGAFSARVLNQLKINNGGFCNADPPFYEPGSVLVYNIGGSFTSGSEWGQAVPLAPGYPHHVLVRNGTTLQAGNLSGAGLETGGDLTLGLNNETGSLNMNSLALPLVVNGNLLIGNAGSLSNANKLSLSGSNGGDLWLFGNFTRWGNAQYNDNGRAIVLKGSANTSINTPGVTISPGTPTQLFSNLTLQKTSGTEEVTLNCPAGITQKLTLMSGILSSTSTNLLCITAVPADAVIGGSNSAYVNGPMRRYTHSSMPGAYNFPIGKTGAGYKPLRLTTVAASGSTFYASYFQSPPSLSVNGIFLTSLMGISREEYWQLDREDNGPTKGTVSLPYQQPARWVSYLGDEVNPCNNCSVAIVKKQDKNWNFTAAAGNFSTQGNAPETRGYNDNGEITSRAIDTFGIFSFGFSYSNVLTLPVKLLFFKGKNQKGGHLLQWEISGNALLSGFELEHSTDGIGFKVLANIAPANTAYYFTNAKPASGINYYRLRIRDKTGVDTYSGLVFLSGAMAGNFIEGLWPHSSGNSLWLKLYSQTAQKAELLIADALGRVLRRHPAFLGSGHQRLLVPIGVLLPGTYFLTIRTGEGIHSSFTFSR